MVERIDDRLRVGLSTGEADDPAAARIDDDAPFCIAIVGDFRGARDAGAVTRLTRLTPIAVDRDDVDAVIARVAPALDVPLGDGGADTLRIEFRDLDDFHPDRLYERLPLFQAMSDLRDELGSTRRGARGGGAPAGGGASGAAGGSARTSSGGGPVPAESLLSSGGLLDQIVARSAPTEGAAAAGAPASSDPLEAFLRDAVEAHVVHEPGAADLAARERLDETIAAALRALLHRPAYQRLEASWRAVDFLARRIETGPHLKLFVVDAPAPPRSEQTAAALDELIRQGAPGGTPWAAVVLDWEVAAEPDDIAALERLADAARAAATVLLAGADPGLAGGMASAEMEPGEGGVADAAARWAAFRKSRAARHVGLALPRFLLRDPYGRATDPCDAFPLEEMESDPPPHESYLWANGAFAVALILARAFEDASWSLEQALRPEIEGLPLHSIDGGTDLKPCAEVTMDERLARGLLDAGIMPLASIKNTDRVHLVRVQSVAEPVAGLAGGWARR